MGHTFVAITLGLIAAIGWGISGFFDAKSSRAVHPIVASFVVNGLLTIAFVAIYFLFLHRGFTISQSAAWLAAGGGVSIAVGALAYFKGLGIGPVSLVSPMSSAYPVVTTLLALAVFHGTFHPGQGVAIILIMAGVLTVTQLWQLLAKRAVISRGPLLGLFTALCWGVGYALVAQAVQQAGWQQATLVELIAMMLTFFACIPFLHDRKEVTLPAVIAATKNANIVLASALALIACLSFNAGFGYDATGGAIVAALSAFYPVLTVTLALRHFKESVTKPQLLGVIASITGVILLTVA